MVSLRPILRDARFQRASQDEVLFRGEILDPHGEERRLRRVSNHEFSRLDFAPYTPTFGSKSFSGNWGTTNMSRTIAVVSAATAAAIAMTSAASASS